MPELEQSQMECGVIGKDEKAVGIEVYDERDVRHTVNVEWDGDIEGHYVDEEHYPHAREDRTQEEQRIMTAVEHRAKYEAQKEFPEADIIHVSGLPEVIERAMAAVQQMDADRFAEAFRPYYEAVVDPATALPGGIPPERAQYVMTEFTVTAETEVGEVGHPNVVYVTDEQTLDATAPNNWPAGTEVATLYFPAGSEFGGEFEYPGDFFRVVQTNLVIQIRDRYHQMGEDPPEQYQVDGPRIYPIVGTDEDALLD